MLRLSQVAIGLLYVVVETTAVIMLVVLEGITATIIIARIVRIQTIRIATVHVDQI